MTLIISMHVKQIADFEFVSLISFVVEELLLIITSVVVVAAMFIGRRGSFFCTAFTQMLSVCLFPPRVRASVCVCVGGGGGMLDYGV